MTMYDPALVSNLLWNLAVFGVAAPSALVGFATESRWVRLAALTLAAVALVVLR